MLRKFSKLGWVKNIILVDRMREQQMVDGDWMRINKVTCVQDVEGGPVLYIQSWLLGSGGWSMARVLVLLPSITFQNTTPAINQELNLIT